jgi:hypothetical protein
MGLDGCLITYPAETSGQGVSRYWIPGVLVDKQVYLFDTRLGMPLPGPDGKGVATLAGVRTNKNVFDQFAIDSGDERHRYDMTPEQVGRAEVLLTWPMSALAPRMVYLENLLASMNNKVRLSADPAAVQKAFDLAAKDQKLTVRLNNRLGDFSYPTPMRVLRHFLPAMEGGVDAAPPGRTRQAVAELELIPWRALPPETFQAPYNNANLIKGFRYTFGELFEQFPLPPPRNPQIQKDHNPVGIGKEPEKNQGDVHQRFEQYLRDAVVPYLALTGPGTPLDRFPVHYSLKPNTPRDDLLRGRWDDATTKLVVVLDQVRLQKSLFQSETELPNKMSQWFQNAVAVQAELQKAVRGEGDLDRVKSKLAVLWLGNVQPAPAENMEPGQPQVGRPVSSRLPSWLAFVLGLAAEPMGSEATYTLALAKQEKAERGLARLDVTAGKKTEAQAKKNREEWETAANWWRTYLNDYAAGPEAAAARLEFARCLEVLNQREQARQVLSNLSGNLTSLDETARLYRAKRLQ